MPSEINLSESRQTLQNELEPSVFFPAYPPPFPLHLSSIFSVSSLLSSSLCLSALSLSHPARVMSSIWLTEYPFLSLQSKKRAFKVIHRLGGVISSRSSMSLSPPHLCIIFLQVSHVLNVAYGVSNLFPDQMVYKTLQILDLPDTEITSYLEECSSFIDQAQEQVHYHTNKHNNVMYLSSTCTQ